MEKRDISPMTEKYREEMMRLYGKSTASADIQPAHETVIQADTVSADEAAAEKESSEAVNEETESVAERYPEPDLSELDDAEGNETSTEDTADESVLGDRYGYIAVNVRTGDDADPIVGAAVTVSSIHDGKRLFIKSGMTDISGRTELFEVPVPPAEYSQSPDTGMRPYSLFDISVKADGFFNARSVDVPAFEGITSVQNFSMIPVPLLMRSDDETVTYFNQEPDL